MAKQIKDRTGASQVNTASNKATLKVGAGSSVQQNQTGGCC